MAGLWRYLYIVKSWASVLLPSLYFPARVICGGELQFYPTAAILLEIEKIFQNTGGKDVQPETSSILSRKQAGSSAGNRQGFESRTGEENSLTV